MSSESASSDKPTLDPKDEAEAEADAEPEGEYCFVQLLL